MVPKALFALLSGQTNAGDRVFPNNIPQRQSLPAITFQEITGDHLHTNNGGSPTYEGRWQVTVHAKTYAEASTIRDQVRRILDGYSGTAGGILVKHIMIEPNSMRDIPFVDSQQEQLDRFGKALDFRIFANEQSPNN